MIVPAKALEDLEALGLTTRRASCSWRGTRSGCSG
jgi:hypothetical protein